MVIPFYPPLAHDEAGLNFTEIGIVFATSPLGAIFGGVIAGAKMQVNFDLKIQSRHGEEKEAY